MPLPSKYSEVFMRYVADLRQSHIEARAWWDVTVDRFQRVGTTRAKAEHLTRLRWPMGPTSHPRVLATFRKYFLVIEELNDLYLDEPDERLSIIPDEENLWGNPEEDPKEEDVLMQPRAVLLQALLDYEPELGDFMKYLVFLPIGEIVPDSLSRQGKKESAVPLIFHDTQMGSTRLLEQGLDLFYPLSERRQGKRGIEARPSSYLMIYREYVAILNSSTVNAVTWWNSLVVRANEQIGDVDKSIRLNYELRPAGPASHPFIVATVREYWLKLTQLPKNDTDDVELFPPTILLNWLIEDGFTDMSDLLTGMPYWPIGLDENGNWC